MLSKDLFYKFQTNEIILTLQLFSSLEESISLNPSTPNRRFKVRMRAIGRHLLSQSLPDLRQNNRSKSLIYIRASSPPEGIQLIESIVN